MQCNAMQCNAMHGCMYVCVFVWQKSGIGLKPPMFPTCFLVLLQRQLQPPSRDSPRPSPVKPGQLPQRLGSKPLATDIN